MVKIILKKKIVKIVLVVAIYTIANNISSKIWNI